MNAEFLKLQPVKGIYAKVSYDGSQYEIYKVDPRTDEYGTRVPYEIAVGILEKYPTVVTLVQQVKDGKIVEQVSDEELARIHQERVNRNLGMKESKAPVMAPNVAELEKTIADQKQTIGELGDTLKALQKQVAELSKKSGKEKESKKEE